MYALIAAFVLAATPAWAQKSSAPVPVFDRNGVKFGTVTVSGNRYFVRDAKEELLWTIVVDPDGTRTAYDPDGNIVKTNKLAPKAGPQ